MRRGFGIALLALGVAFIVLAPLLRWVVTPRLEKTPFDSIDPSVAEARGVLQYDVTANRQTVVPLVRATRTVVPDVKASTGDVIVLDESLCTVRVVGPTPPCVAATDPRLLSVTTDRVASDRHTGQAVNEPQFKETVDGEPTAHVGLSYKFPFNTEKTTYQFFDTVLRKAYPMRYQREEDIQGLTTYVFVQQIPTTPVDLVPGLKVPGTYANTRTVWIEPRTGLIVKGQEQQRRLFSQGALAGKPALLGTLTFTDATVNGNVKTARDGIDKLNLIGTTTQIVLLVLGVGLVVVGLVLLLGGRHEPPAPARHAEPAPEPVGAR